MEIRDHLISRLDSKDSVIGIIGLGYVGLPLVLRFVDAGYSTIGFDIDADKVGKLNAGQSYIEHIPSAFFADACDRGFRATTDFGEAAKCDALIICVPTPLNKYREPDLSFVLDTTDSIVSHLRRGQVVALESTTWPGTTE